MKIKIKKSVAVLIRTIIGFSLVVAGIVFSPIMYLAALYTVVVILLEKSSLAIFCYLSAWLHVSAIFKLAVGSVTLFTLLEFVTICKLMLTRRPFKKWFLLAWMTYTVYLFIGMGSEYPEMIKAMCVPLLIYLFMRLLNYSGLKIVSLYYFIGLMVSSVIGLLRNQIPNMSAFVNFKQQGLGVQNFSLVKVDRFSGLWGDPNYYSTHLIIIISIICVLFSRREISAWVFYAVYSVMAALGAMTGSKSFILMLLVIVLFTILLLLRQKLYSHAIVFICAVLIALALMLTGIINPFEMVMYRFQNQEHSGFTTGRIAIWRDYLDLLGSNSKMLLFGNGLGNSFPNRAPHNTLLDFIVLFGLFGGLICITTIVLASSRGGIRQKGGSVIPLVSMLILYMFLSMFYSGALPFQIILCAGYYFIPQSATEYHAVEA
ncbi:MAG: hypothetical protein Q4E45_11290 [Eubacteriales bacterium]|nr:hypothetical protein [Eubacteriales bacterium]